MNIILQNLNVRMCYIFEANKFLKLVDKDIA